MKHGLYINGTTNNQNKTVVSLGVVAKFQSKFLQNKEDPNLNKKLMKFESVIKSNIQLEITPNTYIHTGWEYGFKTKEKIFLAEFRFDF